MKKSMLLFALIICAATTFAICSPPSGDWSITGTEQCDAQNIVLNGSIFISSTGSLFLNQTNITLNTTTDRQYNIFIEDSASLRADDSAFYKSGETYDIRANESATVNLTDTTIEAGSSMLFEDSVITTLLRVTLSDDITATGNTLHNWEDIINGALEETSTQTVIFFDLQSNATVRNLTTEGKVKFGQSVGPSPTLHIYASNISVAEYRRNSNVTFYENSTINSTEFYLHTPSVYGNVTYGTSAPTGSFLSTQFTRHYPTYVTDQNSNPVSNATVNVTNSTGALFFTGTTDSNGYLDVIMAFNSTYCGTDAVNCDDDFNISVNSSESLGIQTGTPILLTKNVAASGTTPAVPEFSTWIMILMVAGLLGVVVIRRK